MRIPANGVRSLLRRLTCADLKENAQHLKRTTNTSRQMRRTHQNQCNNFAGGQHAIDKVKDFG